MHFEVPYMERLNCKETKNALSQSERENQIFGQEILSYFREADTLAVQAKLGTGLSQLCSLRGAPLRRRCEYLHPC